LSNLDIYWEPVGFSNCYSGIYQSAKSLFLGLRDQGQRVEVLSEKDFSFDSTTSPKGGKLHKFVSPLYSHWLLQQKILQNKKLQQEQIIFHGHANFNLPLFFSKIKGVKYVLTVHDLIPVIAPESVSKQFYLQFLLGLRIAVKKADKIIVVSEWTKKSLVERFPKEKEKIFVIANAVTNFYQQSKIDKTSKEKKHLDLLYVSRYEPYKRFFLLGEILAQDSSLHLVVVCDESGKDYLYKTQIKQIASRRLKVFVGLAAKELKSIYLSCDVYIHPSLYEGFCLPVRDALLCQVPVVYSLGSAVGELVKEPAGIGVEPEQGGRSWAQAIKKASQMRVPACKPSDFIGSEKAAKKLIAVYNSK
jgi:glycosyltransferase involved in cell wall biosynthesis